jgi:YbgC/YbaW family acyl-CoA thioester hydrolase
MLAPTALSPQICTMSTRRSAFRFLDRLRVRWAEVDLQKIVFNGHYLLYFDTAMAGYWRALALPYHETMAALQGDLYVRKATLEYEASARYDDQLEVGIRCARIGNSSMVFEAAAFRGERRLVHGELVYVFADPATQTSRPVPPVLREWLLGYEAGDAVVTVQTGDWAVLGPASRGLRQAVFADEMGAPAAVVEDAADAQAVHVVAFNRAGLPLATGRLLAPAAGVGQIGRMATLAALRGSGIGQQVLAALAAASRARGDETLLLHAAPSAVPFYARAGFAPTGTVHSEAGVDHIEMRRALTAGR